jgi:hypothetical protein
MLRRGFGFGLFASAAVTWSCRPEQQPCASCQAVASPSGSAPVSAAGAIRIGFCGDGVWDPDREECDDGSSCRDGRDCSDDRLRCQSNAPSACQPRSQDGCSDQCTLEPGFVCREGRDCQQTSSSSAETANDEPGALGGPDAGIPLAQGSAASPDTGLLGASPRLERCRRPSFRAPELLTGIDDQLDLWAPSLASDGRTLFFAANTQGTLERIFFATRSGLGLQFSAATLLANVDSGSGDGTPVLSADGLRLYFYSRREGGSGDRDLWFSTRPDAAADFGAPSRFGAVNSSSIDHLPWVSADELTLLYVSTRAGGFGQSDIWFAKRSARSDDFPEPELFSALSSNDDEGRAVETRDGKLVVFTSGRAGGQGDLDLWLALRDDGDEFVEPVNLSVLNSPSLDVDPFLSADERELFFSSNRAGRAQIWRSLLDCDG